MKVLFISAEVDPFAKVGGLADVVGSLPAALRANGIDARVLMPYYATIPADNYAVRPLLDYRIGRRLGDTAVSLYTTEHEGVPVYFLRALPYFGQENGVYSGWNYDAARFTFFSQAVFETCHQLAAHAGFMPDVLHAHDWHTGSVPFLLTDRRRWDSAFAHMGAMFTIHNLAYQGDHVGGYLFEAGVPGRDHRDLVRMGLTDNMMAMGIAYSDVVTTVSPRYSVEIQFAYMGYGLHDLLRTRMLDLHGILNGIDAERWNPATDPHLVTTFDAATVSERRLLNKRALQAEAGLPVRDDVLLIGVVSRLVDQKGFDVALPALDRFLAEADVQLVVLGSGDPGLETGMRTLGAKHPGKASVAIGFNAAVAQHIYGGCDLFLMPSHYEPCGVGQMLAMRYGALPLVRATGGLADTVENYDNGEGARGTGFVYTDQTPDAILSTLRWALWTYQVRPDAWARMQQRALARDFRWTTSAERYAALYAVIADRHKS